jgi:hypothetical protein
MQNNQSTVFSLSNAVKLTALAVGGYALWRNRFKVQRLLQARGFETPWMNHSVTDAVQSGAAKSAGSFEHIAKKTGAEISQAAH